MGQEQARLYGGDRGLNALARGVLWSCLVGRWQRATELIDVLEPLINRKVRFVRSRH